jgi:glyoxylase-like metal-dependent hydrolase (beta-lactamase superfamily II)
MAMPDLREFKVFTTASGARIYSIPVEAFPHFWAYVYLVVQDDWRVLIDCGSGSERSNASLETGLMQAGVSFQDLTHILITHGHIDHFGGLTYLRQRTNASVGVHELDLQTISAHEIRAALLSRRLDSFLLQAGLAEETRQNLLQLYLFTKALYHSVPVDFTYQDRGMHLGPFEMIHVPGHCPGHVAIRFDNVVFSGDLLLEGVTPHQSPEEITPYMGLAHYLQSIDLFRHWAQGASLILAGHGAAMTETSQRVTALREHLSARLVQVLDSFAEPRTIAEAAREIYGDLDGYNALLVIEKVGAYVEYLVQRGWLKIKSLEGPVIRYQRVRQVSIPDILPKERAYVFV